MYSKICVPFWMKLLLHLVRIKMQERTFKRLGWKSWYIKSILVARWNVNFFHSLPSCVCIVRGWWRPLIDSGWGDCWPEWDGRTGTGSNGRSQGGTGGHADGYKLNWSGASWASRWDHWLNFLNFVFIQMAFLKQKLNRIFRGEKSRKTVQNSNLNYFGDKVNGKNSSKVTSDPYLGLKGWSAG